jgi:hypothetical protein
MQDAILGPHAQCRHIHVHIAGITIYKSFPFDTQDNLHKMLKFRTK